MKATQFKNYTLITVPASPLSVEGQEKKRWVPESAKRVPVTNICLGAYYVSCLKRLVKKNDFEGSYSNVDLGLFQPNN